MHFRQNANTVWYATHAPNVMEREVVQPLCVSSAQQMIHMPRHPVPALLAILAIAHAELSRYIRTGYESTTSLSLFADYDRIEMARTLRTRRRDIRLALYVG